MKVFVLMMCWLNTDVPGVYHECRVEGVFRHQQTAWQVARVLCHDDPDCPAKTYVVAQEIK